MSVDTPAGDGLERGTRFDCAICRDAIDGDAGRFLASYATADDLALAPAEADGLLPACGDCSVEVAELTVAWTPVERPPVGTARTIAESYQGVAEACSFCDSAVDEGPVLGLDSWPGDRLDRADGGGGDPVEGHENYVLCRSCVSIFEEFLQAIASE